MGRNWGREVFGSINSPLRRTDCHHIQAVGSVGRGIRDCFSEREYKGNQPKKRQQDFLRERMKKSLKLDEQEREITRLGYSLCL